MPEEIEKTVTRLLRAMGEGSPSAAGELVPLVYRELHRMARRSVRSRDGTLQPTALVNEAYMKLVGNDSSFENRRHFFCAAARAMRDVLVDDARRKSARKRGGDWKRVDPESLNLAVQAPPEDLLALEEALERLGREEPDHLRLVDLRFFAGLGTAETAAILGTPERTVQRQWRYIRARLFRELGGAGD